jgi:hypothetical protein
MRIVLVLGLSAAFLASCGGGSDKTSDSPSIPTHTSSSNTSTTKPTPTVSAAARTKDEAFARRGVFQLSDFPQGWREDTVDKSPAACPGYYSGLAQTAHLDKAFTRQDEDNVDSLVRIFATTGAAKQALSRLSSQSLRSCYARTVKKKIASAPEVKSGQLKLGDIKIGALSAPSFGEDSAALQIVLALSQSGIQTDVYSDSVFVRQGRALLIGTFTTQDSDFDADLMGNLMRAASKRLAR